MNNIRDSWLSIIAEWLEEKDFYPLVPRSLDVTPPESLRRILAIAGPRRAGKTYYMHQIIQAMLLNGGCSKEDILFIDFEDYRLGDFAPNTIDGLLTAFQQLAGRPPRFLFFDEVQRLPGWSRVLRTLHNSGRYKIIVSGSNSQLLSGEIAAELRGRYDDVLLLPFSFEEYLRYREIDFTPVAVHTAAKGRVLAAFDEYIRHGGFPEVVMASHDAERRKLLQGYFRTIFYRDIIDRHHVRARFVLDSMMNDALDAYSSLFSISRFEKQLKSHGLPGSKRTISNYLQYLENAFFIITTQKFSYSPRRRIMNPKKLYLTDTGFAAMGRPYSDNRGRILENIVAIELQRRETEYFYFQDHKECDFIVQRGRRPKDAIQVCWELNNRNRLRELAGLKEAGRALGLNSGLILTYDQEEDLEDDGRVISVRPVWKWLLSVS